MAFFKRKDKTGDTDTSSQGGGGNSSSYESSKKEPTTSKITTTSKTATGVVSKQDQKINELTRKKTVLERTVEPIRARLATINKRIEQVENDIKKHASLPAEKQERKKKIDMNSELAGLENRQYELEMEIAAKQKEIDGFSKELNALGIATDELKRREEAERRKMEAANVTKLKTMKQLNMTFSFTNAVGRISETNEEAANIVTEETELLNKRADPSIDLQAVNKKLPSNGESFVSLESLARRLTINGSKNSYLFMVFDSDVTPPMQTVEDIVLKANNTMIGRSSIYFTNDYSKTDPKNYVAIVQLNERTILQDAISIAVGKTSEQTEELRQASSNKQASYGWIERAPNSDELRIILPYVVRRTLGAMKMLFMLGGNEPRSIIPIVPREIQALISNGTLSDNEKTSVIVASSDYGSDYLDIVNKAFHEKHIIKNSTEEDADNRLVTIPKNTGFYHYAGNAMFPKGSHTNLTSNNLLIIEDEVSTEHRQTLLDFYQKHPSFDSIALSTRPPVTASVSNGITMGRYISTVDIEVNGTIERNKQQLNLIDTIYNLFVFAGSHTNESFLMNLTELCARINYDPRCESSALVVWSTVPRNSAGTYAFMEKLDGKSQIDFVTFHYQKSKEIADFHLWLFTCYNKNKSTEKPPLLWELDLSTIYNNDLLRTTPYSAHPTIEVHEKQKESLKK